MEPCTGCGAVGTHPWVAVMRDVEAGCWVALPVCPTCWRDPEHRLFPIKGHFFPADQADIAVHMAGSPSIG